MKVFVTGAGKVGRYVASMLANGQVEGFSLGGVWNRTPSNLALIRPLLPGDCQVSLYSGYPLPGEIRESSLVLITVSDGAILPMIQKLHKNDLLRPHQIVLHTCGSRRIPIPDRILSSVKGFGTMHPLLSMAPPSAPKPVPGTAACPHETAIDGGDRPTTHGAGFLVEGTNSLTVETASALAKGMGGIPFPAGHNMDRATYHAAACMASSLSVTLILEAARMISRATGLSPEQALPLTMKLNESAMDNLTALGFPDGVTGPAMRGDVQTLELHREALAQYPDELELYRTLSELLAKRTKDTASDQKI